MSAPMYEVAVHWHGRPLLRISSRPLGKAAARVRADAQPHHAIVREWGTAVEVYDNGKAPAVPDGMVALAVRALEVAAAQLREESHPTEFTPTSRHAVLRVVEAARATLRYGTE